MHELRRAVFYPHSAIMDPALLKRALLFYDEVELIVPYGDLSAIAEETLQSCSKREQGALHAAAEFLIRKHVPTDADQKKAHKLIEKLLKRPAPDWFVFEAERSYEIYPQKFMLETWEVLTKRKLAWRDLETRAAPTDYEMHSSLGLSLMGILAAVRAGQSREKITDVVDAHRAYMHYVAALAEGVPNGDAIAEDCPRLESIPLPGIDLRNAELEKLLELRVCEDAFVKRLRRKFQKVLAEFRQNVAECKPSEREEVYFNFKNDLEEDIDHLEMTLELERGSAVVRAGAAVMNLKFGDAIEGLTSSLAVAEQLPTFRLRRQEVLEEHPSAWLFLAKQNSR